MSGEGLEGRAGGLGGLWALLTPPCLPRISGNAASDKNIKDGVCAQIEKNFARAKWKVGGGAPCLSFPSWPSSTSTTRLSATGGLPAPATLPVPNSHP